MSTLRFGDVTRFKIVVSVLDPSVWMRVKDGCFESCISPSTKGGASLSLWDHDY